MRKDFDTGQTSQLITYRQLYSLSQRLVSVFLCIALLGTLFLQAPLPVAGSEDDTTNTVAHENDFPLSSSTSEGESVVANEENIEDAPEVFDEVLSNTTGVDSAPDTDVSLVTVSSTGTSSDDVSLAEAANDAASTTTASLPDEHLDMATTSETMINHTASTSVATSTIQSATSSDVLASTTTAFAGADNHESVNIDQVMENKMEEGTHGSSTPGGSIEYVSASDDSMMQFDRTKCTPVAGGSYYCQNSATSDTLVRTDVPDGLHALPDSDGDLEIFLVQDGEFTQLTFNTVDDAAPAYDPVSNMVVWHRSVADRYQIMMYDFATETETQLTNDAVNNMQPVKSGEYIAWQRWVDNNWQIMLYDGENTTQLTYTNHHNIAPAIRGTYLLWKQQRANQSQTVEVYDLQTKQQYSISDPDGGVIANPRMMLLYESEFENGDVVTRGLDLATNEVVPIQGTPMPLPENIPSSEPLDEVRALVTKTSNEDTDDALDETEPTSPTDRASATNPELQSGDVVVDGNATTTATSSINELNQRASTTTTEDADFTIDLQVANEEDMISEHDVLVTPFSTTSTTTSAKSESAVTPVASSSQTRATSTISS